MIQEYSPSIKNPWMYVEHPVIEYKWYHHVLYSVQAALTIAGLVLIASMPVLGYALVLRMIYD